MAVVNNVYTNVNDSNKYQITFEIKTKVLYENIEKALNLIQEVILKSDYEKKTKYLLL